MSKPKQLSGADKKLYNRFPQLLCQSPQFNGSNFTNRVIYQLKQGSNKSRFRRIYYCPAYLSLQNRNFANMAFEDLVAQINTILILTINFRGIKPVLQRKIRSLLTMTFNRDDSIRVKQNSKETRMKIIKSGIYTYKIQKLIHIAMKPYIAASPLQKIDLIMSVCLKSIQMNKKVIEEIREQIKQRQQIVTYQLEVLEKELKQYLQKNKKMPQKKEKEYYENEIKKMENSIKLKKEQNKCLYDEQNFLCQLDSIQVHFNFMDSSLDYLKVSYTAEGSFSTYDVCQSQMQAEYTNIEVPKKTKQKYDYRVKKLTEIHKLKNKEDPTSNALKMDHSLIKPFNYAHFTIPLYKKPIVAMITIFLPLWLLSVIMLGIYFQDSSLSNRLNNLSVLLIAYIGLVGIIRGQLPQSPKVTLIQALVYLQIFCGLLLFGQSLYLQGTPDYVMVWTKNVPYLISVTILALQVFIVMVLMLIYVFYLRPKFVRTITKVQKFNYLKWLNKQCDRDFRRRIDNGLIKVSQVDEKLQNIKQQIIALKQKAQIQQDSKKYKPQNGKNLDFHQAIMKVIDQIKK